LAQQVGSWSRSRHEEGAAIIARRREAVRQAEAEQTGGVVAEPVRMADPAPAQAGRRDVGAAAVPAVAEVESLLRRGASRQRAAGPTPALARTGEAPRRDAGAAGPGPSDSRNETGHQPFTGGSRRSH